MSNVLDYFTIKCKSCGSHFVEIEASDNYNNDEEYCGSNFKVVCRNCYNSYLIESED